MVNIPDNYQVGGEAAYSESDRLRLLRERQRRQNLGSRMDWTGDTAIGVAVGGAVGAVGGLFSGMMLGVSRRRTKEAIKRREAEEQAAANERRRIEHYEATYGKFDLTSASAAGARQAPATDLLSALRTARV